MNFVRATQNNSYTGSNPVGTIAAMHGVIATIHVPQIAGVALRLKRLITAAASLATPRSKINRAGYIATAVRDAL